MNEKKLYKIESIVLAFMGLISIIIGFYNFSESIYSFEYHFLYGVVILFIARSFWINR